MSNNNNRRRRNGNAAEAEFFVYTERVTVPRNVTHVLVQASVKVLPAEAFRACRRLKVVVLSEGLREIGEGAFRNCLALKSVTLPSTLVKIGDEAFSSCASLGSLDLPANLLEIGNWAFSGCSSLRHICVPSTVYMLGGSAFCNCSSLKEATLVDGIKIIGDRAFCGCNSLREVLLPATLVDIGEGAFPHCRLLWTVELCRGIQRIEPPVCRGNALCDGISLKIPSKALLVDTLEDEASGHYSFHLATMNGPIPSRFRPQVSGSRLHLTATPVAITSECFNSMSTADMSEFQHAITEILGPRPMSSDERRLTEILNPGAQWDYERRRLLVLIEPHELRHKKEVTTLLELGLWKVRLDASDCATQENREGCRLDCGASVIIPSMLPFL